MRDKSIFGAAGAAFLFLAGHASAQDSDIGNDASTRARLAPGRDVAGTLEQEGDVDWYRLAVRNGQRYRITLNGGDGEGQLGDPMLRLLDTHGAEILANDDAEGLNSMIEYTPPANGAVFVEAGAFGGALTGAYTLAVAAETAPTDNTAAATNTRGRLTLGESVSSEIAFAGDSDWYRIRLEAGQSYRFSLSGSGDAPLADPLLTLHSADGEQVAIDDDGGEGLNAYLEFTAPTTANYFVEAHGFDQSATGGYTLSAIAGDIPADISTDAALSAEGDYREAALSPGGDRDWYRVDLPEGGGVRVGLSSAENAEEALGDPMLVVYGPDGAEIGRDDDGGEGLNAWLEVHAATAGAYYVEVRGFVDDAAGRYALNLVAGEIGADANSGEYLVANGEGRTSTIGYAADVDWFAIDLVEGRPYRFNLEGVDPDALGDPVLTLFDAEGRQLATDDDGGRGANAYLTFASTAGGTYFAAVSSFEQGGAGRYLLRVSDADVPGNTSTDEILDASSDERLSRIDMPGDLDNFAVELEAGVTYTVDVSGAGDAPLADPFMAVLDSDGKRIVFDDDSGGGLDARLRFTPGKAGIYFIQASGLGGSTGWYQVSVERRR